MIKFFVKNEEGEIISLPLNKFHSGELIIPKYDYTNCNGIELQCFYDGDEDLFQLLLIGEYFEKVFVDLGKLNLFIPYIPYSRMDRFTDKEYEQFSSLKRLLYRYYDIVTCDLHNSSTSKGLKNFKFNFSELEDLLSHYNSIILPDKTAFLRFTNYFGFDYRMIVLDKVRENDKILSKIVFNNYDSLSSLDFLIVDDICSKGGTFINASELVRKELNDLSITIDLFVSHAENGIFAGDLFSHIDHVYTTDSILTKPLNDSISLIRSYRNNDQTYII